MSDLETYIPANHEIIIVDDGSSDNSYNILSKYKFIKLIQLDKNYGKGVAIKEGIKYSSNEKLILFDGDRELKTNQIHKLMVLDDMKIRSAFACRKMDRNFNNMLWNIGNRFFTFIFNLIHNSSLKDALCCAKSFNKSDILVEKLQSSKFDIDVEIACQLIKTNSIIYNVYLDYDRRGTKQGKKLRIKDGIIILYRIFRC